MVRGAQAAGECVMKLTNIPHFKEIILMCFACEQCGYKSVDIKPGGEICNQGVRRRCIWHTWTQWWSRMRGGGAYVRGA